MKSLQDKKIAIIAAKDNPKAIEIKDDLVKNYGFADLTKNHKNAGNLDLLIAVGGDGLMLHLLHEFENNPVPIYGLNCGTIGFLMNSFNKKDFIKKLSEAKEETLHPLRMEAIDCNNKKYNMIAINEVAVLRQSSQAAHIKIEVNDRERISCLIADGALISTSAGSTAYNLSARGPIIPFGAEILALTPISPFRPRNWNGALLPANSKVKFKIQKPTSRPTSATADSAEVKNVKEVTISEDRSISFKILFDSNHSLEERIIREQFND